MLPAALIPLRRARLVASLALALASALTPATAWAQDASVQADGWWNRLHDGVLFPVPPPTSVPEDALGVGHNGAEPDKLAAVRIDLEVPVGSSVRAALLTMVEHEAAASGFGEPLVAACAITTSWNPARNGIWPDRPDYDCELGRTEGERTDDGVWTFDLAPHVELWLDPELPLDPNGVVLVIEESDAPAQVSFGDITTGDIGLEVLAGDAADEPEPSPAPPLPIPAPLQALLPAPPPAAPTAPATPEPEPAIIVTEPTQAQREVIGEPNVLGNLPLGTALLVPLLLVLAAATSYVLGPAGTPGPPARRMGAVSRALGEGQQHRDVVDRSHREGAVSRALNSRGGER